jgi:hypothetical protein
VTRHEANNVAEWLAAATINTMASAPSGPVINQASWGDLVSGVRGWLTGSRVRPSDYPHEVSSGPITWSGEDGASVGGV